MKTTGPPKFAEKILGELSASRKTGILGDTEEEYRMILVEKGRFRADMWYTWQIFQPLPFFIRSKICWSFEMFKNYLKIALRIIKRYKGYSFINITGLAVGIACSILVMLYVFDELSYDTFHEKADRIYRIVADSRGRGDFRIHQLGTPAILSKTILEKYPQAEQVTRITGLDDSIVRYKKSSFKEQKVFAAEPSFFDIFSFPLLEGDAKTALAQPNSVVITKSAAKKYFRSYNPYSKVLSFDIDGKEHPFKVTGILKDVPENSHFHFDFLVSLKTFAWSQETNWFMNNHRTYLLLQEGVSEEQMEKKLAEILDKYAFAGRSHNWKWTLEPLTDIHLFSDLSTGTEPNSDATYVAIFTITALLILLIACINFMNLSTASSAKRAREVGIRKVVGSQKSQLIKQFLGESILFSFCSLVLALLFIQIFLPYYRHLTGKSLLLPYFGNVWVIPGLIGLTLFVGFISGIYPAFFLSSYKPVHVLKSSIVSGKNRKALRLRNGLVIFQFSMSALLIIGTVVIYEQLEYIRNRKLGFDEDHVIVIHNTDKLGEQSQVLKQKLLQFSSIENVTSSSKIPGKRFSNIGIDIEGIDRTSLNMTLDMSSCDQDFCGTLKMEMAEGRFFSPDFPTDISAIVINEETVRYFGLTNPIGKHIHFRYKDKKFQIIGVIKNIHYESLHKKVKRMGLVLPGTLFSGYDRFIFARVSSESISETLDFMKKTWASLSPGLPFEYSFFDEELDGLYKQEVNTGQIVATFSLLAIFISCFGIFGLSTFMAEQRTKEIGVRKILGAKLSDIILLLSKEFMKWVLIANLLAWPIGFFIMNRWLENFAYRIDVGIEVFLLTGGLAMTIAMITISFQVMKAATANPVDSLRYE